MNKHLQRILSLLCALALILGTAAVFAEATVQKESRVIAVIWDDANDTDGIRPTSLTATLTAGETNQTVELSPESWTGELEVPAGTGDNFSWGISGLPGSYSASQDKGNITRVTCSHTPREITTMTVTGTVKWEDSSDHGQIRPGSVHLMLLADSQPCAEPVTLSGSGDTWTYNWNDMPKYRPNSDVEITYTVKQLETPDGYDVDDAAGSLNVVNSILTGNLKISVTVAGAPDDADLSGLRLIIDGPEPGMPYTETYGQSGNGTRIFTYNDVLPGAYLVRNDNADSLVKGYAMDTANSKVADAAYLKDNDTVTLEFKYTWKEAEPIDDIDPDYDPWSNVNNLTIMIYGPDSRMPYQIDYSQFEKIGKSGRLELDDLSNLVPGVYTVVETNAEGLVRYYTLTSNSITGVAKEVTAGTETIAKLYNEYIVAPTPVPGEEFVDIPVTKTWIDNNDNDGNRPNSVTVRLYADGVEVDSHVLTAAENWTYTFTEKPRYQEDFKTEIKYTVNEDNVPNYNKEIKGYNLVNKYTPVTTQKSVYKKWDDNDNKLKLRPSSIAVTLYNGQTKVKVVVLSAANNWFATVDNLPTVVNGQPAVYTWKEQKVLSYVKGGTTESDGVTTITNRIYEKPDTPPEKGRKPKGPGDGVTIPEYETPLGVEVIINHVGDCFD